MALLRTADSPWRQQVQSDQAEYLRRGVQPASESGVASIRYSNADCFYLVSGSAVATTITFASATKNTGAECIVLNRSAGRVIVAAAGGTLVGSATQSAAAACSIWRSDGTVWRRLLSTDAVPDPLAVGTLTVADSASFSGSVAFLSGVGFASSVSISGSVAFGTQPAFPIGAVTSITGGAMIVQAGARLYEMSPGAGTVALVLPDAASVRGLLARVKIKNGSTGQLLLSAAAGRIEPQSATASSTITMSGAYDYATFVAGQSDWWIA